MRLEPLTLADIAPQLEIAATLGVERFAFTGGEPLILKDIHAILLHALRLRPTLVLTNGTAPFIRRAHHLASLRAAPHALSFPGQHRLSGRGAARRRTRTEEFPQGPRRPAPAACSRVCHGHHADAGTGRGPARSGQAGFATCCASSACPRTCPSSRFRNWACLRPMVHWFPPSLRNSSATLPAPGCSRSRMLLRRDGRLRIAPCALVDDTPALESDSSLSVSLLMPARLAHARCVQCLTLGVDYAGAALG